MEYQGKKYVRVIANTSYDGKAINLSNGQSYRDKDPVWIEVSPVKWLVDEEHDIAITENIIFSGVQFDKETEMYRYLNTYFINDLMPSFNNILKDKVMNTYIKLITLLGKRTLETKANGIFEDLNLTDQEQQALAIFLSELDEDPKVISSFMAQISEPAEEIYNSLQLKSKKFCLSKKNKIIYKLEKL